MSFDSSIVPSSPGRPAPPSAATLAELLELRLALRELGLELDLAAPRMLELALELVPPRIRRVLARRQSLEPAELLGLSLEATEKLRDEALREAVRGSLGLTPSSLLFDEAGTDELDHRNPPPATLDDVPEAPPVTTELEALPRPASSLGGLLECERPLHAEQDTGGLR